AGPGGWSLLGGWLTWTPQVLAIVVLLAAAGWRDRRWRVLWLPVAAGIATLTAAITALVVHNSGLTNDPIPTVVWVWVALVFFSLVVVVFGWRGARWWRRGAGLSSVALCVLCIAVVVNQWVGYLPDVYTAWANVTNQPVHHQVTLSRLHSIREMPSTGQIVPVTIPDVVSHFAHRTEYVYLPPVWFRGPGHPRLPVLEMVGAEFHKPADWIRTGRAATTADAYASRHHGYAPIMVFVDADGSFRVDTECVDGVRGNAASHLTEDIPPYIARTFGASTNPRAWGIVGWSMGGTCAVDLAVKRPDRFDTFEDISGDLGPNIGNREQTIAGLYAGHTAEWAENDPLTVLAHQHRYPWTAGWFEDATRRGKHGLAVRFADELSRAARKDDIATTVVVKPGSHNWQFGAKAFADALPWLARRLAEPITGGMPYTHRRAADGRPEQPVSMSRGTLPG
ncbi:MAG: alpha/beta hydrolase, partial [Sciscionella sp.]